MLKLLEEEPIVLENDTSRALDNLHVLQWLQLLQISDRVHRLTHCESFCIVVGHDVPCTASLNSAARETQALQFLAE